ncbi:MAG TPA: site-2 protease family protein [Gemmataceae bacterium]|jgi:Zn-dependent protease|nr:site-2 protease family protein [Gemmataceae bacterium]
MGRSLRIGTAFGIGLYVHWTFLIIPLIAILSGAGGGLDGILFSTGLIFGVFGCVLLHELGHALTARSFGIDTRDITLLPIGGVARLERMSDKPGEEIAIAVAGPLVNVVIAAGLWLGLSLAGLPPVRLSEFLASQPFGERLLAGILFFNIVLVLFNMIPAFPMDGGRVFRALLSFGVGRLRGTEIAVAVSKVFAVGFIASGIWWHQFFLPVIGLFIMVAGSQELAMLRHDARKRRPQVTIDYPPAEPPAQPAQPNFSGFIWDPRAGAWVEWRNGQVVGATYVNGAAPRW